MITRPCPSAPGAAPAVAHEGRARPARAGVFAASALAGLFLAACGGGGAPPAPAPGPPPAPTAAQVPVSAAASIEAWEAFTIAQAPDDRSEPMRLDLIASVPTSETASPVVLP
jgi:hypothetical protein